MGSGIKNLRGTPLSEIYGSAAPPGKGRTIIFLEGGGGGGMKNIEKKLFAGPKKTK